MEDITTSLSIAYEKIGYGNLFRLKKNEGQSFQFLMQNSFLPRFLIKFVPLS